MAIEDGFDWDHLRYFLAVARTGRLTAAAARLRQDHTTVSRRIAALERAHGDTAVRAQPARLWPDLVRPAPAGDGRGDGADRARRP